ncbi:MAG: hypothetical protein EAX81_00155 [Candidatus Thorarchaeota archaeon]|nr:hypothetical protein [Candidatus Thorarchaeota archaeon]
MFLIRPEQIRKEAELRGVPASQLGVPEVTILTFNKAVLDEIRSQCGMQEWQWEGWRFSPYSTPLVSLIGNLDDIKVALVIPPMGASPLAALCHELIHFGTRALFLLCASWSLGPEYLDKGEIHLPTNAIGIDGTSIHYGNCDEEIGCESSAFEALAQALDETNAAWKQGAVGSCEALYRITPELAMDYRNRGCLSMENGEAAALYSLARVTKTPIGVLFQPYIDLTKGWSASYMDEVYSETCRVQARAALRAIRILNDAHRS